MPRSLNEVTLLGHLGQDAETRAAGGSSVTNFSLATERVWKDKQSGEIKKETDWHRIVAWRVGNLSQYLTKGKPVLVKGRLQTRKYEKDGQTHYATEIVADNIILLGGAQDGAGSGKGGQSSGDHGVTEDDVPF
jgi:single-strand DNA-binding protein